jgi:hypothetical protein
MVNFRITTNNTPEISSNCSARARRKTPRDDSSVLALSLHDYFTRLPWARKTRFHLTFRARLGPMLNQVEGLFVPSVSSPRTPSDAGSSAALAGLKNPSIIN